MIDEVLQNKRRWFIAQGDSLALLQSMPSDSVHCCVTSPPYWGLRDYGVAGQLGLEKTPDEFVAKMVEVFREVRRVLHPSGTAWVNLGDSYAGSGKGQSYAGKQLTNRGSAIAKDRNVSFGLEYLGLKPKDLVGIPWMVAFALRADGWYLRSEIIWAKHGPMPEPVQDRPVRSHEQIFLLSKSKRYFYDIEPTREPLSPKTLTTYGAQTTTLKYQNGNAGDLVKANNWANTVPIRKPNITSGGETLGAAKRDVWVISRSENCSEAHFATFPPELPRLCILAGSSESGCCPECGNQWERVKEASPEYAKHLGKDWSDPEQDELEGRGHFTLEDGGKSAQRPVKRNAPSISADYLTTGWRPTCKCNAGEPLPSVVIDPFSGAATTGLVALRLGRRYVGLELNPDYVALSNKRIIDDAPLFNGVAQAEGAA